MQITRDDLIESLESTANFCRGASLDPAIPALVKGALQARAKEIDAITDAALKDGGVDGLTFGLAVEALKKGMKVARAGWNGKGMWLRILHPRAPHPDAGGDPAGPYCNPYFKAADNNEHAAGTMISWIGMETADNKFVPWLTSQTDMLAEDWLIVE